MLPVRFYTRGLLNPLTTQDTPAFEGENLLGIFDGLIDWCLKDMPLCSDGNERINVTARGLWRIGLLLKLHLRYDVLQGFYPARSQFSSVSTSLAWHASPAHSSRSIAPDRNDRKVVRKEHGPDD